MFYFIVIIYTIIINRYLLIKGYLIYFVALSIAFRVLKIVVGKKSNTKLIVCKVF